MNKFNLHNLGHALSGVGNWIAIGGPATWITIDAVGKKTCVIITLLGLLLYAVGKGILIYTGESNNDNDQQKPTP